MCESVFILCNRKGFIKKLNVLIESLTVVFPENHDTLRFAKEYGINKEKAVFNSLVFITFQGIMQAK